MPFEALFDEAAECLLSILKIYPDPMQLLDIFQQTLPAPVFNKVMDMMASEFRGAAGVQEEKSEVEQLD